MRTDHGNEAAGALAADRHPRLEKPLTVAFGAGGVLVAVVVGLVAVVALTT
ncbi:hypothetical protein [Streptomyces clavifer]|uniref:hypothetical protein n=1 Tax=Streptomyces clavifer TaxID=68188 RepID=UPI00381B6CC6